MKAYICTFFVGICIIVAAIINKPIEHKCEWDESRIQMIEATTIELIAASEEHARRIEAISSVVLDWNVLFRSLYSE